VLAQLLPAGAALVGTDEKLTAFHPVSLLVMSIGLLIASAALVKQR
jgi:hypothetical protein